MDRLETPLVRAGKVRLDRLLDEARSGGITRTSRAA
jgi:hypothetical protein